ncbi:hypothetical protein BDZ89DRAFT_1042131 [Hymenopellis radicata]|nr:hypothetical protein BDZ89DRAFT_1042131 [Hymenopellis radicata]
MVKVFAYAVVPAFGDGSKQRGNRGKSSWKHVHSLKLRCDWLDKFSPGNRKTAEAAVSDGSLRVHARRAHGTDAVTVRRYRLDRKTVTVSIPSDIVLSPRHYPLVNWLFQRTQEISPGCRIIRWHMDVQLTYGQAPKPVLRAFQRALAAAREDGSYKDVIRLPEVYLASHGPTPSIQEISDLHFPCTEIVNDRGLPATWEAPVWPVPAVNNAAPSNIHWDDDIPTLEYPSSDDEAPATSEHDRLSRTLEVGPDRRATSSSRPAPYRKGGFRKTSGNQPGVQNKDLLFYNFYLPTRVHLARPGFGAHETRSVKT